MRSERRKDRNHIKTRGTRAENRRGRGAFLRLACLLLACFCCVQAFAGCVPKNSGNKPAVSPAPGGAERTAEPTREPTPAPTPEPTPEPNPFAGCTLPRETKLNYFAIPTALSRLMGENDIELYKRVVSAYFAGESFAELPQGVKSEKDYPDLWRVVDMYCPVFFMDVDDASIIQEGGRLIWKYTSLSAEEHFAAIDEFEAGIVSFLSSVPENSSLLMRILAAYQLFTNRTEYDGTHLTEGDESTPYVYRHAIDAIRSGRGVCWCFARAFNFIICQLGAESLTVHGLRRNDRAIHEWVVFRHGDEWRYCDPTWDINGKTLNYFGFTISVREHNGFPERDVSVLEGSRLRASRYFDVRDTFFAPLFTGLCSGSDYRLDHGTGEIIFMDYDDPEKESVAFSTLTGEYRELGE